jgi:serine/threonine protein kinase
LTVGDSKIDVFIKRPRRKQKWKVLLDCFRPSRTVRAFRLGHALLTRRISTALPLVALEKRRGPVLTDSILITEAVEAPTMQEFFETWLSIPPRGDTPLTVAQQRQLAQEVLAKLGRMVQILHDNRFAHRDLKATNILVLWAPGQPPEVVLIDLDGLKRVWLITTRRKYQGLMRLNVSLLLCPQVNHAGRLRMLLGYLRRPGCGKIEFKPFWRVLEQWSARKIRDQIRSRRKRQRANRRPAT